MADQGKIPRRLAEDWKDSNKADRELDKLIGWDFNWNCHAGAKRGLIPPFPRKELEKLPDGSIRVQNSSGLIEKIKPGVASIPSEDDYLLKDRKAFETLYRDKMMFKPERVDREIERLAHLVSLGGFIPCPDHRLMPSTKFELVQYYAEEVKKIKL